MQLKPVLCKRESPTSTDIHLLVTYFIDQSKPCMSKNHLLSTLFRPSRHEPERSLAL